MPHYGIINSMDDTTYSTIDLNPYDRLVNTAKQLKASIGSLQHAILLDDQYRTEKTSTYAERTRQSVGVFLVSLLEQTLELNALSDDSIEKLNALTAKALRD